MADSLQVRFSGAASCCGGFSCYADPICLTNANIPPGSLAKTVASTPHRRLAERRSLGPQRAQRPLRTDPFLFRLLHAPVSLAPAQAETSAPPAREANRLRPRAQAG